MSPEKQQLFHQNGWWMNWWISMRLRCRCRLTFALYIVSLNWHNGWMFSQWITSKKTKKEPVNGSFFLWIAVDIHTRIPAFSRTKTGDFSQFECGEHLDFPAFGLFFHQCWDNEADGCHQIMCFSRIKTGLNSHFECGSTSWSLCPWIDFFGFGKIICQLVGPL